MDKEKVFQIFLVVMVGLLVLALFYYGFKYIYYSIFRPGFRPELNPLKISHIIIAGILEWLNSMFGPIIYRICTLLLGLSSLSIGILAVYCFWKVYMASS